MIRPNPEKEQGAALLTVLLWVAIVGAISAAALDRLRISTRLSANNSAIEQARALATGVEQLLLLTVDDFNARNATQEGRAALLHGERRIRLPLGAYANVISREGGDCFNINSVGEGDSLSKIVRRPTGIAQFEALMVLLGTPLPEAHAIAQATGDWVDADMQAEQGGAEDDYYTGIQPSYRTGNTLFADVSELRAVAGMTEERFAQLQPWICALPSTDLSPINPNSLSESQAPLLAMLAPAQISLALARAVLAKRPPAGWPDLNSFYQTPELRAVVLPGIVQFQPQLRSGWLQAQILITYQQAELTETVLIDHRTSPARIAVRHFGDEA